MRLHEVLSEKNTLIKTDSRNRDDCLQDKNEFLQETAWRKEELSFSSEMSVFLVHLPLFVPMALRKVPPEKFSYH